MVTVNVLMSTYNGADFLKDQIESILNQIGVKIKLFIRDDGSSDNTVQIAEAYEDIVVIKGDNIGVGASFMKLLYECPAADYYAFADQDDIWDSDKLISAVNFLKKQSYLPALYVSNQRCVDKQLNFLNKRFDSVFPTQTLLNVLFMNLYAGCTMVLNKKMWEQICAKEKRPPLEFFNHRIHDAWIACVALSVGTVIYDDQPHMSFRRHGNNQTDAEVVRNKHYSFQVRHRLFRSKIQRLIKGNTKRSRGIEYTAKYLLKGYDSNLTADEKKVLLLVRDYRWNIKYRMKLLLGQIITQYAPEKSKDIKLKILFNIL